ncbi:MAG: phosphate ABC transporter substrate-binding protein PstS [Nitrososphaera sp.]
MQNYEKRILVMWPVAGMLLVSIVPLILSWAAFAEGTISLNGAGATFPFLLIDQWRLEYRNVKPDVSLNYQPIGSGGGISQFTEKTVDFGGTDAPLTATQRSALSGPAVHIPETIGSVVAAYNLIGVPDKGLKLAGPILADIFLGKITKWDDARIKELNPDLTLPSEDIVVVHRADGSGTTFVWTDYLSKVSAEWKDSVGRGTAVSWPTGIGGPGNQGVASAVRGNPYTIGYVELAYALTTGMDYAFIQNQAGNFIEPSLESTKAAVAASAATLPKGEDSWEAVSLTDAPGEDSYPIASFSYLLLYKELSTNPKIDSIEKARALVEFVDWAITDGQELADELHYVPLPEEVVALNKETLASITFNGQPVMEAPAEQPFTVSSSFGGNTYTITGMSENVEATSFTINPEQSVEVKFEGSGDVEMTLPNSLIDGITAVTAGGQSIEYTETEGTTSTTLMFTLPEGTDTVEIQAAMVVPEFEVVAALILAAAIVGVVGFMRFKGNAPGPGFGQRI